MNKKYLLASLALTVPAIAITLPAEANTVSVQATVYSVNGQNVSVNFETFTAALNAEVLKDLGIRYIQMNNSYYDFELLTNALNASDSLAEAFSLISTQTVSLSNIVTGTLDTTTGKFVGTASTFEVTDIK